MLKLETSYEDDYAELLPVFLYSKESTLANIAAEMDRSLKKATKLITMHSLTVKPARSTKKNLTPNRKEFLNKKEYNKWVDDAYLLMGKSQFYRKEYSKAKETFNYVIANFGEDYTVFESKLWLARLAIEEKRLREAEDILQSFDKNIHLPKKLNGEISATWADFYLRQEKYNDAIDNLTKALDNTKRKTPKSRYYYLLAQLYQKTGNDIKASECFNKVVKMNPPYKMAFNAKINRALAYQGGTSSRKDIEKQLLRMLKDDKNIEFQDQIYYAVGQLYLKDGNKEEALIYFKKSLQAGTTNTQQKARTSLIIADLYYNEPDYVNAQSYYDSTVTFINPDFPGYQIIYTKSVSLSNLVTNINTVHFEDSVLKLSLKPQAELYALIDVQIENERKREQELRDKQAEESMNRMNDLSLSNELTNPTTSGGWYFYNSNLKTLGQKEFVKLWGNRKLEDNWRRKNRSTVSFAEAIPSDTLEESESPIKQKTQTLNKRSRNYYLVNIPFSDSAKKESNKRIANSLFAMGEIYNTDLKDYPRAVESYEELIRRYPLYDNRLQAYYKLYLLAKEKNNTDNANIYKQRIINEFPNSNIAKLLTNPNYYEELRAQERAVFDYYQQTLDMFNSRNFAEAGRRAEKAIADYPTHELRPKFDYIYTISAGLQKDTTQFLVDLQHLIAKYPQSDLAENAQQMIKYLTDKNPKVFEAQNQIISRQLYSVTPNEPHYFVYIVPSKVLINQLIFNIINFNIDNFDDLKLEVTKANLNPQTVLCLVSKFANAEEALKYYNKIITDDNIFRDVEIRSSEAVIISQINYKVLIDNGKYEQYLYFFKENYKK
jgi:tetratricopeptide (TPR) repeat protein